MTRLNEKVIVALVGALLFTGVGVYSQTTLPPGQVRSQPTTGLYVNVQGKGLVLANLDPATLVLDTTTTPPILKAVVSTIPPVPAINEKHVSLKPAVGQTIVVIPDASFIPVSLGVYVNGLVQSPGDDYTITGTTVTFNRLSVTGDIVQLHYRF